MMFRPVRLARSGASALLLALAVVVLCWLGWNGTARHDAAGIAARRAVRVAELSGSITYLNEVLTMSAHLAAASGDPQWREQYDEIAPKLDSAIQAALQLASPEAGAALMATTEEAHRDLVTMREAVFRLLAEDDRATALSLLNGPEYRYLQSVYATGLETFGQDLERLTTAQAESLHERAWLEMAALAVAATLFVAILLMLRGHVRLRTALARTETVARTDSLTLLPNRRHLYAGMTDALRTAEKDGASVALLLIDLDRFKPVNEVHGHAAGDTLLQLAAQRLRGAARPIDVVARLGGNEFALLVSVPPGDEARSADEVAGLLAGRIVAQMEMPFELSPGLEVQVGATVGVALRRPGEADVDMLVRRATVALQRAKKDSRGHFRLFEPGMETIERARALLEADLRRAVASDALVPFFQPLVALGPGRIVGFEMLARWPGPDGKMVPPGEFIPVAEESGLIGRLTASLMRQACSAAALWPGQAALACNISPLLLRDRTLPTTIRAILEESGLPPHRLELEITESALVGDLQLAREVLSQLKGLGVKLALDDFGTGYSGLRHLHMLPFDKIKIDASFVSAMTGDTESRKIVAAVVGLGHSLGLPTVAEGVETEDAAALLRELGCDVGQGWLFGRPAPAEQTARLLEQSALDPV